MARAPRNLRTIGWEKAVLGTALHDPETMERAELLVPADFTGEGHQALWAQMIYLHRRGNMDLRAVVEGLRQTGDLDKLVSFDAETVRGEDYIAELMTYRGHAMQEYVDQVTNASIKRSLLQVSALIAADAQDQDLDAAEVLDEAERRVLQLRRSRSVDQGVTMGHILSAFMTRMDAFRSGEAQPAWVPKLGALRRKLRFVEAEDFVLIAARPGEGKSSLLRFEFFYANMPTLIFNLENTEMEYARYCLSMMTGIDSDRLKDGRGLSEEELETVRETAREMAGMPVIVKTLAAPSIAEVDRISRQHIKEQKVGMIGIDYLQLVQNGRKNRVDDVTLSSQGARAMALRYHVPVVAAAQMSRSIEHRGEEAAPKLSDLRESGSLEQDATIIAFPRHLWPNPTDAQLRQFPHNVDPESGQLYENIKAVPMVLYIEKNRNGPIGRTEPFLWVKSTNNFYAITSHMQEPR